MLCPDKDEQVLRSISYARTVGSLFGAGWSLDSAQRAALIFENQQDQLERVCAPYIRPPVAQLVSGNSVYVTGTPAQFKSFVSQMLKELFE